MTDNIFPYMTEQTRYAYNRAIQINRPIYILNRARKNLKVYARMKVCNKLTYNLTLRFFIHEIELITGEKIIQIE